MHRLAVLLAVTAASAYAYDAQCISDAIAWNTADAAKQYRLLRPFSACVDDPEAGAYIPTNTTVNYIHPAYQSMATGTGNLSVLFIGNSYSHRASMVISQLLDGKYSKLRLFARSACNPASHTDPCTEFFAAAKQVAELQKPDIIFLIFQTYYNTTVLDPIVDINTDATAAILRNFVGTFSALAPHVVYETTFETPTVMVAQTLVDRLSNGSSIDDLKMDYAAWQAESAPYYQRIATINYPNVVVHSVSPDVCSNDGYCYLYNQANLHALYTDNLHFSPEGLEMQKNSFKNIINGFYPGLI